MALLPSPDVNASSSNIVSYFDDSTVPFKKRFRFTEALPEYDDEEAFYSKKIEALFEKMRNKFAPNITLATKRAKKMCPPLYIENDTNNQKKRRKISMKMKHDPVVISNNMFEQLKIFVMSDEMNGSDLKLVIQKKLYTSDLKDDQNRLSMPIKQLQTLDFLKPDEKVILDMYDGIKVGLVGPNLRMYNKQMVLTKWDMNNTSNYVLINNWRHFVTAYSNDLKLHTKIQVWSFRRNHQELCFAIVIVRDEEIGS